MMKTTIYMPDTLKQAVTREATRRGVSEAEVIRDAINQLVGETARPRPHGGLFHGGEAIAARTDELLIGFGE